MNLNFGCAEHVQTQAYHKHKLGIVIRVSSMME